jgi:hypothetical protein
MFTMLKSMVDINTPKPIPTMASQGFRVAVESAKIGFGAEGAGLSKSGRPLLRLGSSGLSIMQLVRSS